MFKISCRDANKDAKYRDLSEAVIMFMGIGGKEMTNVELLREEQDLLARKMMRHHQKNYLEGSGTGGSGRPLTPERTNSSFESSKYSHGGRDSGINVMKMSHIIAQEEIEHWHFWPFMRR